MHPGFPPKGAPEELGCKVCILAFPLRGARNIYRSGLQGSQALSQKSQDAQFAYWLSPLMDARKARMQRLHPGFAPPTGAPDTFTDRGLLPFQVLPAPHQNIEQLGGTHLGVKCRQPWKPCLNTGGNSCRNQLIPKCVPPAEPGLNKGIGSTRLRLWQYKASAVKLLKETSVGFDSTSQSYGRLRKALRVIAGA